MPLFGVGFKPKTDDKGNELTQKEVNKVNKVVLNQLIIKKDKREKRFYSFPLLSTAPCAWFIYFKISLVTNEGIHFCTER
jgi:hypothetical protein